MEGEKFINAYSG